jgi:hypothetical protein
LRARRPEVRWRRQPSDIPDLTALQAQLLEHLHIDFALHHVLIEVEALLILARKLNHADAVAIDGRRQRVAAATARAPRVENPVEYENQGNGPDDRCHSYWAKNFSHHLKHNCPLYEACYSSVKC